MSRKTFKSSQFREEIIDSYNNKKTIYTYTQNWKMWKWEATRSTRITL